MRGDDEHPLGCLAPGDASDHVGGGVVAANGTAAASWGACRSSAERERLEVRLGSAWGESNVAELVHQPLPRFERARGAGAASLERRRGKSFDVTHQLGAVDVASSGRLRRERRRERCRERRLDERVGKQGRGPKRQQRGADRRTHARSVARSRSLEGFCVANELTCLNRRAYGLDGRCARGPRRLHALHGIRGQEPECAPALQSARWQPW